MDEIAKALRARKLSPTEWQDQVEQILREIDLPDLLARIDFDRLQRSFQLPENSASNMKLDFRDEAGAPEELNYGTRLFGMKKGRSIVPHGHHNLVSAHLLIKGELHVRNYQRLSDEPDFLIIQPTIDRVISVRDFQANPRCEITSIGSPRSPAQRSPLMSSSVMLTQTDHPEG